MLSMPYCGQLNLPSARLKFVNMAVDPRVAFYNKLLSCTP